MPLLPVLPARGPWPLHDAAASRAAEATALAHAPPHALMARAGLAVARLALARWPHAGRIHVSCGPGNNGGDGLVAARHLQAAGRAVTVSWLGDAARAPADAAWALAAAREAGLRFVETPPAAVDLVVDALLGLGAARAPEGRIAAAIAELHALGAPCLAVDLPSGLHPDTGQPLGPPVVRADATLALLTLKPGLFTGQGRDLAGAVWFDDLGIAAGAPSAELAGPPTPPARRHAQHKGNFGDLVVVGGAPGMIGAAVLAARAALAAGAGRVYLSALDAAAPAPLALSPELMTRPAAWTAPATTLSGLSVVCGCGGGVAVRAALPPLLAHAGRLVLDADALNAIGADPALLPLLAGRARAAQPTVLTPHPLEAARLLGTSTAAVQADRLAAARELAARTGATVVLKGSGSVVAHPSAGLRVNPTGNALLATAGTGDVLAGWIGGLLAAGLPPERAAAAAVWRHGLCADRALADGRETPLTAARLIEAMAAAG